MQFIEMCFNIHIVVLFNVRGNIHSLAPCCFLQMLSPAREVLINYSARDVMVIETYSIHASLCVLLNQTKILKQVFCPRFVANFSIFTGCCPIICVALLFEKHS